jgi:WD40 repeat protein/serine/threonine protein kinase
MEDLTGKVLKSYEIKESIGAGGFGAVYRALQPSIGREVAIKIILPQHANQPEFIRRFEIEAQLVALLEHPHIVPLYDYWREPGGAFLVMRYLRGGSLRDSLEQHGAWSAGRVAQMVNQIASALAFAHVGGVIHRDLKTDNILIDEAGNSYLTDFGIAKDLDVNDGLTQDGILGTPAYLSPEQIRGEAASVQSDIYALGILVFEALTAVKPFYDATPATTLYKQLNDPLPSLLEFRKDLPEDLDIVLQRATSKDATLRYENTLAFARDFTAVVRETAPGLPATGTLALDIMSITEAEAEIFEPKNPYKGLRAFQQADADDFFGRDELVQELIDHLAVTGNNHDFLAVVGPSGSGKSSIVKAGMLPQIQNGALNHEVRWYTAEMVTGTHPLEELEAALLAIATTEMPGLMDQLRQDERGFVRAVKRIIPEGSEFVLFIDQFEETFTLVDDEDERAHFLQAILNAVEDERSRIKIIVTLRADFYDRPLLYQQFGNLIRRRTETVLPLNDKELEATIVGPAERVGMTLEPGLVAAIVNDVYQQPGALPLLQYALTELFERRDKRKLILSAYREIGGTAGALARRAEELYQNFDEAQQAATRQMFLRLVTLGEGTDDTRRRVFQAELLSLGNHRQGMRHVIDRFGKYRLLTFDHDPQTRSSTIELAHEALIRQWERMREWLDDNREALRLHRRLRSSADEWNQSRRDPSFLASGVRLQQFEEWEHSSDIVMSDIERAFLEMSVEAREQEELREQERKAHEEELERRAEQRLRLLAVVMTIAAVLGFILAFFAYNAQQRAEEQAEIASNNAATAIVAQEEAVIQANNAATSAAIASENEAETRGLALAANARNAAASGDPQLALALALAAKDVFSPPPTEVLRTLSSIAYSAGPRYRFMNHSDSVVGVAFSEDNQYVVSASVDGSIRVLDNATGEEAFAKSINGIWFNDAAIHPENSSVAAVGSDGLVYVWSFPQGEPLFTMRGHLGEIMSVVYSSDGAFILTGGSDHKAILWGATNGNLLRTFEGHTGAIYKAVFSPDASRIATSSGDETLLDDRFDEVDRTVRIWDAQTGEQLLVIEPHSGFVRALDYSPLGDTIAYGVWDGTNGGTVRIHDATTGEELDRFFGHTTPLLDVIYSSDASQILTIAWDRNLHIWDIQRGVIEKTFSGFGERLLTADFSNSSDYIVLGLGNIGNNEYNGNDNPADTSVWVLDIRSRDQILAFTQHSDWIWTVDISPNGEWAASAGGPLSLPEQQQGQEVQAIDTTVRVWDIATGQIVSEMRAHTNTVDSVRFHPDGKRILSSSWDGLIILWDIASAQRRNLYRGHDAEVFMVRFLGDGSRFVSVGAGGKAILWDTESAQQIRVFEHDAAVYGVDFSPDGTLMATTSGRLVYLWDIESGEMIRSFAGHTASTNEVRFHPGGKFLISTAWEPTIRAWDVTTGEEIRRFNGHTGNTFGIDFSEDGQIMLTTSSDTTVRMWDWESAEELHRFDAHLDWVQEVVFEPVDRFAISGGQDPAARVWRIDRTAEELEVFAHSNRYIRELSCDERDVYRIDPPCEQ